MNKNHQINQLRKAGQLDAAQAMAESWLAGQPEDGWARQAYAWVLYDLAKQHLGAGDAEAARACVARFAELELPPEEALLHERFGFLRLQVHEPVQRATALSKALKHRDALQLLWRVFRREPDLAAVPALHTKLAWGIWHLLRELPAEPEAAWRQVQGLTGMYRELSLLPRPSLTHSMVLSQLLRLPAPLRQRFDFLAWFRFWNIPDDFEERDWQPYQAQGKQWLSTAEKACNAWCKALAQAQSLPTAELEDALGRIEAIAQQRPGLPWLPYYIGKIRITHSQGGETARQWLLPFVRAKHTEFWVWDLLADTWAAESDEGRIWAEACLCQALLCRAEPQFLPKVRLRLAKLLIGQGKWPAAKYEIEAVAALKAGRGEPCPTQALAWQRAEGYAGTACPSAAQQQDYYRQQAQQAEALVFGEKLRQGVGVIEGIDPRNQMAYFALTPEVRGRFPIRRFSRLPLQLGQFFRFRLLLLEKGGRAFWQVLDLAPSQDEPEKTICQNFKGPFRQFGNNPVGMVGKAFIPAALARALQLRDGQPAHVRAVWSFDPKRQKWGWKAVAGEASNNAFKN